MPRWRGNPINSEGMELTEPATTIVREAARDAARRHGGELTVHQIAAVQVLMHRQRLEAVG